MKRLKIICIATVLSLLIFLTLSACSKGATVETQAEPSAAATSPVLESTDISELPPTNYPTNTEISYGFLDYTKFSSYLTHGTYRCGTDFEPGDYYILSVYGANALFDVSDNPDGFSWTHHRMIRKVSPNKGQYVRLPAGALLIPAQEIDLNDLSKYGIFLVGIDLPEGEYKIVSLEDTYRTEVYNVSGICGAYQIGNGSPFHEFDKCSPLFEKQTYISVKNGQYVCINNAKMILADSEMPDKTEQNASGHSENDSQLDDNSYEGALAEYTLNDIRYSLPESWKCKTKSESIIVFQLDSNQFNLALIQSEKIPAIMKIGEDGIYTKECLW